MSSTEEYGNQSGELGGRGRDHDRFPSDGSRVDLRGFGIRCFLSLPFPTLVVPSPPPSGSSSVSSRFSILFTFQATRPYSRYVYNQSPVLMHSCHAHPLINDDSIRAISNPSELWMCRRKMNGQEYILPMTTFVPFDCALLQPPIAANLV